MGQSLGSLEGRGGAEGGEGWGGDPARAERRAGWDGGGARAEGGEGGGLGGVEGGAREAGAERRQREGGGAEPGEVGGACRGGGRERREGRGQRAGQREESQALLAEPPLPGLQGRGERRTHRRLRALLPCSGTSCLHEISNLWSRH